MFHPVFISYARGDAAPAAAALHAALGPDCAFLDSDDIETEEIFPRRLAAALEGATVIVVLATPTYFQRWYCLREWMAALLPWTSADVEVRATKGDRLLEHLVVVRGDGLTEADLQRLPPPIQRRNLAAASDRPAVLGAISSRLGMNFPSLGERCASASSALESLFSAHGALPLPPRSTTGVPVWPTPLRASLGEHFLGRANEFWQLHDMLWTRRMGDSTTAPMTAALHGGGGFGKTQLAVEYLHRMGPSYYRGGLFWIDASETAQPLEEQQRGILTELGEPSLQVQALSDERLRAAVAAKLTERPGASTLVVVDNVPEPTADVPAKPLSLYCPPLGRVTCLMTSRARRLQIETLDVGIVSPRAAILMLQRGLPLATVMNDAEWNEVAEWVGRLPLALDLLNSSMRAGLTPESLLKASRSTEVSPRLDALAGTLKDEMPPGAVRGITDAFSRSLDSLPHGARRLASRCAWLPPAPIPRELMEALADEGMADADVPRLVLRSFVRPFRDRSGPLQMHRVLASFLRGATDDPPAITRQVAMATTQVLATVNEAGREPLLVLLAPHAAEVVSRLIEQSPAAPPTEDVIDLLERLMLAGERASAAAPLVFAVRGTRAVIDHAGGAYDPPALGQLHRILGRCLYNLASRQTNVALLAEAMAANEASLAAWQRAGRPVECANVQNQMGVTLEKWGEREPDGVRLDEAVAAYEEALRLRAEHQRWTDWAGTQNNLGNALTAKATRTYSEETARRAIEAYRAALTIYTPDDHADRWADVQGNLATGLRLMAEITGDMEHFAAAERALLSARLIFPRERDPIRWAALSNSLGLLWTVWGGGTNDVPRIRRALDDLRASLSIRNRADFPVDWAMTQNNLGRAYTEIGSREESVALLWRAVMALKRAMRVRQRSTLPLDWGTTTKHLGRALKALGGMRRSSQLIELAITAYEEALTVFDRARFEREWAALQTDLGDAFAEGVDLGRPELRPAAESAYRSGLEVFGETARGREVEAKLERL